MELAFLTILGEPKSQKRHRTVRMGSFNRQYDPSAADKKDFLSIVQNNAPEEPYDCPLRLIVYCYFSRPKNHFNSRGEVKLSAPTWHTGRPDADNCLKFVCDALNKIYWRDDSILCEVGVRKKYSTNPRIEIKLSAI